MNKENTNKKELIIIDTVKSLREKFQERLDKKKVKQNKGSNEIITPKIN